MGYGHLPGKVERRSSKIQSRIKFKFRVLWCPKCFKTNKSRSQTIHASSAQMQKAAAVRISDWTFPSYQGIQCRFWTISDRNSLWTTVCKWANLLGTRRKVALAVSKETASLWTRNSPVSQSWMKQCLTLIQCSTFQILADRRSIKHSTCRWIQKRSERQKIR